MRYVLPFLAILALAACEPPVAEPGGGVGFQDYDNYRSQQARLERQRNLPPAQPLPQQQPQSGPPVQFGAPLGAPLAPAGDPAAGGGPGAAIAADAMAALGTRPAQGQAAPAQGGFGEPAAAPASPPVQTAPSAPAVSPGSNIVAYALATSHPVGQQMHRRSGTFNQARLDRACAAYPSDGMAQEAFLTRGGPERDPLGLDPDGDGYACRWDPSPFRSIRN
jgi:hypothetical protein